MQTDVKTMTVKEALKGAGIKIDRIVGKVTKLWEWKSGKDGKGRPWSLQSGLLQDGNDTIKFTLWRRPDLTEITGRSVVFRGKGIETEENVYKDKTTIQLSIQKDADLLFGDEEDSIPMVHDANGESITKSNQNPPQGQPEAKKQGSSVPVNGVQEARKRAMQYANWREICDNAAAFLYPEGDPQLVKDVSSCFFIQGSKEGMIDKMPNNKPLSDHKEKPDAEPDMAEKDEIF